MVSRSAQYMGVPEPGVVFWEAHCPERIGDEWAHCHVERGQICVSLADLRMMNFDQIDQTATHEVTHLRHKSHNPVFQEAHTQLKIASWRPPAGTTLIRGDKLSQSQSVSKRHRKSYRLQCQLVGCSQRKDLKPCPFCGRRFCPEHIRQKIPSSLRSRIQLRNKVPDEARIDDEHAHACQRYEDQLTEQLSVEARLARIDYNRFLTGGTGKPGRSREIVEVSERPLSSEVDRIRRRKQTPVAQKSVTEPSMEAAMTPEGKLTLEGRQTPVALGPQEVVGVILVLIVFVAIGIIAIRIASSMNIPSLKDNEPVRTVSVSSKNLSESNVSCIERWVCDNWSSCVNGVQSRRCSDSSSCGMTTHRPPLVRMCR